jgi:hypothetical protein
MSKYLICTLAEYEKGLADGVPLDEQVSLHDPIYSPNGEEVLVKGIGSMTHDDVKAYTFEKWSVDESFIVPEVSYSNPVVENELEQIDYTGNQPSPDDPV